MSDLTCPYTLDWLEDPVTLPCCGRTVSRTPLLVSLNITQQCSLCRGDLSNYNALTAPMSRNIAYLVEEAKNKELRSILKERNKQEIFQVI